MKTYTNVFDLGDLKTALAEAFEIKNDRYKYESLGKHKTCLLIFFNNSLRTRLSTQKAARNLGMDVIVLDVNQGAWKLETERGVVMDGDKSEHLLEAIPVMASYCDIIGVRSFAQFESRTDDYTEKILNQFIKYSGKPVFSMEAATGHPLQAFADLITIEEYKKKDRPKVVLTWAPHPKALPQAVPNSFADFMNEADVDFVITHPEGYELDPKFVRGAKVEYDQMKAFEGADFIYAKNWACPGVTNPADYGKVLSKDMGWTVDAKHMAVTNNAYFMHCLPVRRNMIVTDDVIEAPTSLVIPEAANREISATVVLKGCFSHCKKINKGSSLPFRFELPFYVISLYLYLSLSSSGYPCQDYIPYILSLPKVLRHSCFCVHSCNIQLQVLICQESHQPQLRIYHQIY